MGTFSFARALLLAAGLASAAQAQCLTTGTITGTCNSEIFMSGDLTIAQTGHVAGRINNWTAVDTLNNSGTITPASEGFRVILGIANGDRGSIRYLVNEGTINAVDTRGMAADAIFNAGTIGTLINKGTLSSSSTYYISGGFRMSLSHLDVLDNQGTIKSSGKLHSAAIWNDNGFVGTVSNSGSLEATASDGPAFGILALRTNGMPPNVGSIDTVTNTGSITATGSTGGYGVDVSGTIGTLTNSGTIFGSTHDVYVETGGTLLAINNSGTLRGVRAPIFSLGRLDRITNSGLIDGDVYSNTPLSIVGGSDVPGIFSGGTVYAPGVTFSAGKILLRDYVLSDVKNTGGTLELDSRQTIAGNYTQSAGSLVIDLSAAHPVFLSVRGTASVTGSTIVLSGNDFVSGESFLVIDGGMASTYSNNTVVAGPYLAFFSQTAGELFVTIGPSVIDIGDRVGGDAAVMGYVVGSLMGDTTFQQPISVLSQVPEAEVGTALTQFAPAQVSGGAALLLRAMLMTGQVDEVIRHRSGRTGDHGWSLWGQAIGGAAARDADGGTERFNIESWGLAVGVDKRVVDELLLGGALSWGQGRNNGTSILSGNVNRTDSYQLTGYETWSRGAWHLDSHLAFGFSNYDQTRRIDVTGHDARASYGGYYYEALADGGYVLNLGDAILAASASLKWLRLSIGRYSETGAGPLNLSIASISPDQIESGLGATLRWTKETSWGVLQPAFTAKWLHDFSTGMISTEAMLSGVSFATAAARPDQEGAWLGAELALYRGGNLSVEVGYGGEFRHGYTAHSGEVGICYAL